VKLSCPRCVLHGGSVSCSILLLALLALLTELGLAQPRAEVETLNRTVQVDGAIYQAIITRPKDSARHPAVFIIGGLGCYSLADLKPDNSYFLLLQGLTQRGYVTMRVDKNGEGKSQGPPCDSPESDLHLAVRRSVAGLKALATYDFIDRDKIFVFAHSIGPLEGVFVAQQFPVRGFIAAETIGKPWFEYELENARRQLLLLGRPYDEVDHALRVAEKCEFRFFIEKQKPEDIVKTSPECKDYVHTFGVSYTYLQQIADIDPAAEWKKVDVPVLVTYGTSDPATSAEEGRYLVAVINSFHPGRASYVELAGMGHGLDRSPSQRAWLEAIRKDQHGEFDSEFLERLADWLDTQAKSKLTGSQ
jgi:pimeloyl-ACP methyl ester carboxylesterase